MNVSLHDWLSAAGDVARETAAGPLGLPSASWTVDVEQALPGDLWGVYIPLFSSDYALQLGLLSTRDGCCRLAKSLLGMSDDEPMQSDSDTLDAVGEVTNLVAGGVKARLAERVSITLGVPLALQGRVFPPSGSESIHGVMRAENLDVWLVMTGTRAR